MTLLGGFLGGWIPLQEGVSVGTYPLRVRPQIDSYPPPYGCLCDFSTVDPSLVDGFGGFLDEVRHIYMVIST